jgi:transcriptional regulator with XRE-family HTH domain
MLTGEQLRAARAILKLTREDLGREAGISAATIKRLEAVDGQLSGHTSTLRALASYFEGKGLDLIAQNGGGAGVRLAKPTS